LILHYLGDEETEQEVKSLQRTLLEQGVESIVVPGDIAELGTTSDQIVEDGVKAFGRIDVLVSNVGICPFSDFLTMPLETWERTRQVNLDGTFYIVQAVAAQMAKQTPQGGSLIAISSISGLLGGAQQCHYGPTKAAITNLMQNCAVALGKYGIRANAILPGTIETDINKEDLKNVEKREYMINRTLLGRLGSETNILFFAPA